MKHEPILTRGCGCINTEKSRCECTGGKLDVYDWLENLPKIPDQIDIVEVQFKNTRKAFYKNINQINLVKGDIVAVEASPGHDIGVITLVGELVYEQMQKNNVPWDETKYEFKKVYRKAKPIDIEKWQNAMEQEHLIMLKARELASELKLSMKIGDVEFQGDKTKAIFYYIADERVDFRELIKLFAEEFKVRVEMRQIGARQEAGRIGGVGSCGRELCCSTWMTNFNSVTTNAARLQELSLNPLKLAGQCGKLKCCLNYELDCYSNARKDFPSSQTVLQTVEGAAYCQKIDIFKSIMWFSHNQNSSLNMVAVPVDRVKEIIALNREGEKVDELIDEKNKVVKIEELDYENVVGQESLTRFDKKNVDKQKRHGRTNRQRSANKKEVTKDVRQSNRKPVQQKRSTQNKRQQSKETQKKNINDKSQTNHSQTDNQIAPKSKNNENKVVNKRETDFGDNNQNSKPKD